MRNEIYELEISRNREGGILATAGVKGEGTSYRISGHKAWGGSTRLAAIEISQRDMVEFIRCYAPGALAELAAPAVANTAKTDTTPLPDEFWELVSNCGGTKELGKNARLLQEWVKAYALAAQAPQAALIEALKFYADGEHFALHDSSAWDTVSGEPPNFYEDESNTATVEDGSVAKMALKAAGIIP